MNSNDIGNTDKVAKAAHRREYRRLWMRKRRAEKGEYWKLQVGPRFAALVRKAKPKHLSFDQWLCKLIRLGLDTHADTSADQIASAQPIPIQPVHIGRNDLCPCGSGKKFKKCCGAMSR
jgi:hypothetical protein